MEVGVKGERERRRNEGWRDAGTEKQIRHGRGQQ